MNPSRGGNISFSGHTFVCVCVYVCYNAQMNQRFSLRGSLCRCKSLPVLFKPRGENDARLSSRYNIFTNKEKENEKGERNDEANGEKSKEENKSIGDIFRFVNNTRAHQQRLSREDKKAKIISNPNRETNAKIGTIHSVGEWARVDSSTRRQRDPLTQKSRAQNPEMSDVSFSVSLLCLAIRLETIAVHNANDCNFLRFPIAIPNSCFSRCYSSFLFKTVISTMIFFIEFLVAPQLETIKAIGDTPQRVFLSNHKTLINVECIRPSPIRLLISKSLNQIAVIICPLPVFHLDSRFRSFLSFFFILQPQQFFIRCLETLNLKVNDFQIQNQQDTNGLVGKCCRLFMKRKSFRKVCGVIDRAPPHHNQQQLKKKKPHQTIKKENGTADRAKDKQSFIGHDSRAQTPRSSLPLIST